MTDTIATIRTRHKLSESTDVQLATVPMVKAQQDGDNPYRFTATITNDILDRDGEVLLPSGMDAREFVKNGTIFWNHNYDMPLAKAVSIKPEAHMIVSTGEFAKRPADYQGEFFPDFARAMVMQGVVKGVSVGFLPTEDRKPNRKDQETWGDSIKRVFTKWTLLEWSIAPAQANPEAVITSVHKGLITKSAARVMFPNVDLPQDVSEPAKPKRVVIMVHWPPPKAKPKVKLMSQDDLAELVTKSVRRETAIAEARRLGKIYAD